MVKVPQGPDKLVLLMQKLVEIADTAKSEDEFKERAAEVEDEVRDSWRDVDLQLGLAVIQNIHQFLAKELQSRAIRRAFLKGGH